MTEVTLNWVNTSSSAQVWTFADQGNRTLTFQPGQTVTETHDLEDMYEWDIAVVAGENDVSVLLDFWESNGKWELSSDIGDPTRQITLATNGTIATVSCALSNREDIPRK